MFIVQYGNSLVVVTNPEPSTVDPYNVIQTTVSFFRLVDDGVRGAYVVACREPVRTFDDKARNQEELRDLYAHEAVEVDLNASYARKVGE